MSTATEKSSPSAATPSAATPPRAAQPAPSPGRRFARLLAGQGFEAQERALTPRAAADARKDMRVSGPDQRQGLLRTKDADKKDPYEKEGRVYDEVGGPDAVAELTNMAASPLADAGAVFGGTGGYIDGRAEDAAQPSKSDRAEDAAQPSKSDPRAHQAGGLASTAAGIDGIMSGVQGLTGFISFVGNAYNMIQAGRAGEWLALADQGLAAAGSTAQTGAGATKGVIGLGTTAATIASSAGVKAGTAASALSGVGASVDILGGAAQNATSTLRLCIGTFEMFRDLYEGKGTRQSDWAALAMDSLGVVKGAIGTLNSVVQTVSTFCSVAGAATELCNAMPVVGAAVNIALQLVDILMQAINTLSRMVSLVKAAHRDRKLSQRLSDKDGGGDGERAAPGGDDKDLREAMGHVREVNRKRWKRQILPLVASGINVFADGISICGSVLNIVGVATSPAYGAGVGIMAGGYAASAIAGGLKVLTGAATMGASAWRGGKQLGRDVAAGESGNWMKDNKVASALGGAKVHGAAVSLTEKLRFNKDKSSASKDKRYLKTARQLMEHFGGLPRFDAGNKAVVSQYKDAYSLLKATGVSTGELFRTAGRLEKDERKQNGVDQLTKEQQAKLDEKTTVEQLRLIIGALKLRE